jgi:hypothetical protein
MLMSPHDSGVDHHVFVVVIIRQQLENALENPALRPPIEALVNDVPRAKTLWKIPPRHAGSKSKEYGFNKQPIIRGGAANMALAAGKKILDPIPLVIA